MTPIRFPAAVLLVLALAASGSAQKTPREILTYQPDKLTPTPNYLTPIIAPTATSFVVNDDLAMLFVTHRPPREKESPKPGTTWPQLTYTKLGAAGFPGPFKSIALPKPASLAKQSNYPLALAFHPKLPLLYVFQDIEPVMPRADATDAPVYKEFDRVLVYDIEGAEPQLLLAFGRGQRFAFGNPFAAITLDPAATRLFVGNLQHTVPKPQVNGAVGYFKLAADGLPELESEPRKPATDRAGRLAAATAIAAKVPTVAEGGLKRISTERYGLLWMQPCGLGMAAISADVLLFGGPGGPIVWEPGNGRAELVAQYIPPYYRPANIANVDRLVVHPTLPVAFGSITVAEGLAVTDSHLWRTEHADGFPTMLPQRMILYTFKASTPPVMMPKYNRIALGGEKRLALIGIDAEGRLTKERAEIEVSASRVQGLAYSERFDKLYFASDEPPPEKKEPKK